MKIVIATKNRGKAKEIARELEGEGIEFLTLSDFPEIEMPPETGNTFRENALLKAEYVCLQTGLPALADDSGLCVEALGGAPGIYSARYAGEGATDEKNNQLLLEKLKETPRKERAARFICHIALKLPDGRVFSSEGVWEGAVGFEPRGDNGFGYDPLFISEIDGKTAAELDAELKNRLSHRGKAVRGIIPVILKLASELH